MRFVAGRASRLLPPTTYGSKWMLHRPISTPVISASESEVELDKGKGCGEEVESDPIRDRQLGDDYNAKRAGVVNVGDSLQTAFDNIHNVLWRGFWSRLRT